MNNQQYFFNSKCHWPKTIQTDHVKAIILADIHMLGPFKGHWADKLRREWQMSRTFQSSITLFRPDVVFILGNSSLVDVDQEPIS